MNAAAQGERFIFTKFKIAQLPTAEIEPYIYFLELFSSILACLVHRLALFQNLSQARLVHLETRTLLLHRRATPTEQLGANPRRSQQRLDVGREDRRILPLALHARAARSQLGESGGANRSPQHPALLAGPRRQRLPHGRHQPDIESSNLS